MTIELTWNLVSMGNMTIYEVFYFNIMIHIYIRICNMTKYDFIIIIDIKSCLIRTCRDPRTMGVPRKQPGPIFHHGPFGRGGLNLIHV